MTRDEVLEAIQTWGNEEEDRTVFCLIGDKDSFASGIKGNPMNIVQILGNQAAQDETTLMCMRMALVFSK